MAAVTHYALENWTDYVRGLVDEPARRAMVAHLGECAECAGRVAAVSRVAETIAWDAAHPIAPAVLARVHALAGRLPRPTQGALARVIAQVRFDSRTQPAPAGVRTAGTGLRQMVFEADRFQVHVQWERGTSDGRVTVVGRISAQTGASVPTGIPVQAVGDAASAVNSTNEFGEFVIECLWSPSLRLLLPLEREGLQIEVPLATVELAPPVPREPR
jgi:anti-sigma factor RsiW